MSGLLTHISRYSLANVLTTLAGLISFPILTRLLGVSGYGLLAIVNATLLLWVSFGKCGLQHASLRFYSEMQASRDEHTRDRFYSTVLFGMGGVGLLATGTWAAISQLLPLGFWTDVRLPVLFLISAPLIGIRILDSAGISILRAGEKSGLLSTYSVAHRYTQLAFVVVALLFIGPTLKVYVSASLLSEALLLFVLLTLVLRDLSISPRRMFSPALFGRLLGYAIPMLGFELAAIFLNVGDRYVVQYILGTGQLGAYAAAYNLCMYANGILIAASSAAILPAYLRVWENEGAQATVEFIYRALAFYVLLAVPMAAGFSIVGGKLIGLLASDAFLAGAQVVPYIIFGQFIGGSFVFLGAGLFVHKRSPVLTAVGASAALLNLALNLILVPSQGIAGAALATLISYVVLVVMAFWASRGALPVQMPWGRLLRALIGAAVMVGVIRQVHVDLAWLEVGLQVIIGILVYSSVIIILDSPLRQQLRATVGMGGRSGA